MNYSRGVSGTILAGFKIYICPEQNMMMIMMNTWWWWWRYASGWGCWLAGSWPEVYFALPTLATCAEYYVDYVKKIWAMMIVIMSMVVMMVRAMSRGMRMLTTISTSRLKAARFIFARGNLCRIWFPLWLGPGPLLEKPALLFISLTISHHCPPTHFWSKFIANLLSVGWKCRVGRRGATELIWSVIPQCFQLYLKSWPGVNC